MIRSKRKHFNWAVAALALLTFVVAPATVSAQDLDVVFARPGSNGVDVGIGDGFGGFTFSVLDTGFPTDVALGDVNADGNLDIVFSNKFSNSRVCLGDGAGGFTCSDIPRNVPTESRLGKNQVKLGDFDNQNGLDVVFANQEVSVCLNDGALAPTFTCQDNPNIPPFTSVIDIAVGDMNGDGDLDAVLYKRFLKQSLCLGDGTGSLSCSDFGVTRNFGSVEVGDFDNINGLDVLVGTGGSGGGSFTSQLCLNDGALAPTFTCQAFTGVDAVKLNFAPVAVDFDGNGDLDFVSAGASRATMLCLGDGSGTVGGFSCSVVDSDVTGDRQGAAIGDLDNDGLFDVVIHRTVGGAKHRVCLNQGGSPPTFLCSDLSIAGPDIQSGGVAIGFLNEPLISDADGDGVNDNDDVCPFSVADVISLNPNQYAQNTDFGPFEVGPNNDQSIVYDMTTTDGCTCKQIVEQLGVGKGHLKKGCSPSVMEEFTGISAEPDRQARIGKK